MSEKAVWSDLEPFNSECDHMTLMHPPAYHAKFVFSLAPILPDLRAEAKALSEELARRGQTATADQIVVAWVMFQLERHLYLHLEMAPQRVEAHRLTLFLPASFLQSHHGARDLLISQIMPVLSRDGTIPYTERYCRVEVRLPDMWMHFL